MEVKLSDFDYELPQELIAQMPADKRQNSKMLVLDKTNNTIEHKHFFDIVDYIDKNSILVLNNTKVLPARLYGKKDTGGKIEVFLLEGVRGKIWNALIKPSKRVKPDTIIKISDELSVRAIERLEEAGEWLVELIYEGNLFDILHKVGNIPLPPYIERKIQAEELKQFSEIGVQRFFIRSREEAEEQELEEQLRKAQMEENNEY